jgi:hypothetical protein
MKSASNTSVVVLLGLAAVYAACGDTQEDAAKREDAASRQDGGAPARPEVDDADEAGESRAPGASAAPDAAAKAAADGGAPRSDRIVPLFGPATLLEPEVLFDRGDAIVTRFGDRGRDRHAREDEFQSYDHYLSHYWEHRTARFLFVDRVAKGGASIEVSFVTEWKLGPAEFRAWYYGMGSVAHYSGNYAPLFTVEGPGSYDDDQRKISSDGLQYKYSYTIKSAIGLEGKQLPLALGQFMEIEVSQFLDAPPEGRANYYGTVFLYEVGRGGLVPWYSAGRFDDKASERENSHKLSEKAWLGGRTTLPYQYSGEPDSHFMQMATNLSSVNAQPFVRGRRVHHTNMLDGSHDESAENGTFTELVGLAGPRYVNHSCDSCHTRNGRAKLAEIGAPLDKWVVKVAAANGDKDPLLGAVLQPHVAGSQASGEGDVSIARWVEGTPGLRAPVFAFRPTEPALFSARIAPQLAPTGFEGLRQTPCTCRARSLLRRHGGSTPSSDKEIALTSGRALSASACSAVRSAAKALINQKL